MPLYMKILLLLVNLLFYTSVIISQTVADCFIDDQRIIENNIILVGETHGYASNYDVWCKLYDQVDRVSGINFIIAEIDYASAYIINRAIKQQDTLKLKKVLLSFNGSPWRSEEKLRFYKYLIDNGFKGEFVGVDIPAAGLRYTKIYIDSIASKYNIDIRDLSHRLEEIYSGGNNIDSIILLGDEYHFNNDDRISWEIVIRNITFRNMAFNSKSKDWDKLRDKFIEMNMLTLNNLCDFKNKKSIGMWGSNHVYKEESESTKWFASRVKSSLDLEIYSILLLYTNSTVMAPLYWLGEKGSGFIYSEKFNDHRSVKKLYKQIKKHSDSSRCISEDIVTQISSRLIIEGAKEGTTIGDYVSSIWVIDKSKPMNELID